ncbi:cell division protein FtsA [Zavarzinia sp.]|uniref:cell division protein FtsA n=1 Tax=Zavarzinia sp. TaxID=2027920 RepID=UPI003BB792CD
MAAARNALIAALDVGTTKVACFIGRIDATGQVRVIGIGHHASRGMRSGTVTDMEATEHAIRAAVETAERTAGETIRDVFVSFSGGLPQSHTIGVEVSIAGHEVGDSDIRKVLEQGNRVRAEAPDRELIHAIPVGYTIDGSRGIKDPRGMFGERLGVNIHVVTAQSGPIRNLSVCISRAHLGVSGIVLAPYASALACLVEDEMDLGITLIDMGGGATSIAVFYDGSLVHTAVLPIGGGHVTNDIARGLLTPTAHAERMKTLFGSAVPGANDDREVIDVPQMGESDHGAANHVPRSVLNGIIRPRIEETFELVRNHLRDSGFDKVGGRKVVLTGGASQLQGVRELAAGVLDKQVRMGRPIRLSGLAESTGGPSFATAAGLLAYAARAPIEAVLGPDDTGGTGRVRRIGRWLKQNF